MFKALWIEIKNAVFQSFYHSIRFGGLLLIPLIYGFSYIFAFYDPFQKTDQLPIAIVTQKYSSPNTAQKFEETLANELSKNSSLSTGDLNMKIKLDKIILDAKNDKDRENKIKKIDEKHFATIILPKIESNTGFQIHKVIQTLISPLSQNNTIKNKVKSVISIIQTIQTDSKNPNTSIIINNNFKKNYLISFGIDIGSSMFGGKKYIVSKVLDALLDKNFIGYIKNNELKKLTPPKIASAINEYKKILNSVSKSKLLDFDPIITHSQMGDDKAKYGYGLAPFFISVAMWIGGMVMTFAIHKKVYDPSILPGIRYLAKWMLITFGTIVQATLLMGALYIIGFDKLGITHVSSMFGFAIFSGIIFSAVIQAIRFIIPNRNLGIFFIIILLVLQMASSGGLFPIETQSSFYRVISNILPMGHTVTLFRELLYNTNWSVVFYQIGYLSIYLLIVPFAILAYHNQNLRMYHENNWDMPKGLHDRYKISKRGYK